MSMSADGPDPGSADRRPRRGLLGTVAGGAGGLVQSVANRVAPGVVDALDVDEIVQRTDVQALVDRIDVQELLARVDVNALLERLDVDRLLDRVDVNRFLERVDVERLADRLDIDAIVQRVDLDALVERTELTAVVARSTTGVAGHAVDVVRSQGVGLDDMIHRGVDRLLRRRPAAPGGPPLLVDARRTDTDIGPDGDSEPGP